MGLIQAMEFAEGDLETGLTWHLQHNHYPPVPLSMLPICKEAIEAANEDDYYREIPLPEGVLYRGETTAPAYAILEQHHLAPFLAGYDEEEEEEE